MQGPAHLRRRSDRGAAAVEFALVVVPLLYIVFGIISYGYMLSFRQSISQAAGEASRAAAVAPAGLPLLEVRTRAVAAMNDGLQSYGVTCTISSSALGAAGAVQGDLVRSATVAGDCKISDKVACASGATSASCITVTVDYNYRKNSLLPDVGFGFTMPSTLTYTSSTQVS